MLLALRILHINLKELASKPSQMKNQRRATFPAHPEEPGEDLVRVASGRLPAEVFRAWFWPHWEEAPGEDLGHAMASMSHSCQNGQFKVL